MPVQPHLFPEPPTAPEPLPPAAAPRKAAALPSGTAPLWLQRMSLLILVIFCLYVGVIVAVLPWWTAVWDHNLFFTSHPLLWNVLRRGPVRGVISGLGLLDIWIGISEALNYRDHRS